MTSGKGCGVRTRGSAAGFSLLEIMAVVVIIMVMLGIMGLSFANARPSMKVKRDAAQMVSFLRNMWDATKTTGAPLVLEPDYEKGRLAYQSPREGKTVTAHFAKHSRLIGFKLNDRLYSRASVGAESDRALENDALFDTGIYVGEGRGLTSISVLFGTAEDAETPLEDYQFLTMCTLNLITGKGKVEGLTQEALADLIVEAETAEAEREAQP